MGQVEVSHFADDAALAKAAAGAWLEQLAAARAAGRKHLVALSGGRIARAFYAAAVATAHQQNLTFDGTEFFWADERCVPPDDAESNYLLAREHLFRPAAVPAKAIHRIQGELDPLVAAERATAELRRVAGLPAPQMPGLDLILLGMGEDGHVASLFPGDLSTEVDNVSVFRAVFNSPKPPPSRITMSHGLIAAAREVWVLVAGAGKQAALAQSIATTGQTPLAKVIQGRGRTKIFTDISLA